MLNLYRKLAVRFLGGKCAVCGKEYESNRLEVHHIDGNWKNDAVENLTLLCAKHHGEAHARLRGQKKEKKAPVRDFTGKFDGLHVGDITREEIG